LSRTTNNILNEMSLGNIDKK